MVSSGMLRRVALVKPDVSEELSASFVRVTRISELGTRLVVTSNRRTLRRNTKSLGMFCNIIPSVSVIFNGDFGGIFRLHFLKLERRPSKKPTRIRGCSVHSLLHSVRSSDHTDSTFTIYRHTNNAIKACLL
jgi:hypothetical protein